MNESNASKSPLKISFAPISSRGLVLARAICPRRFLDAGIQERRCGVGWQSHKLGLTSPNRNHRRDQAFRRRPLTQRPPQPVREIRRVLRPNVDAEVLQAIGLLAEQVDPPSPFFRTWKVSQRLFTARAFGEAIRLSVLQHHAVPDHEGIERLDDTAQPADLEAPSGTRVADAVLFVLLGFQAYSTLHK